MSFATPLAERLACRLQGRLPGRRALRALEPELSHGRHCQLAPASARPAAVLALLYPRDGAWHVPLTLRPETMVDHAGQVSFPGGLIEPGEESAHAALREYEEELGAPAGDIQLLGTLSPIYLFVSNFAVTPWVGIVEGRPAFAPNPIEVAELLEVPLAHVQSHEAVQRGFLRRGRLELQTPHFQWQERRIWGATGMMLAELAAVWSDIA